MTIEDLQGVKLSIPMPIQQFLFDYNHSKFLECNFELSKMHAKEIEKNMKKIKNVLKSLNYLTKTLESMQKHYSLLEGTLLGWYRDCGVIPYTQDADIGLWIEEFEEKIIDKFIGNEKIRLLLSFGNPNDSYELRFTDDFFQYDAFYLYKHNATHQFLPYFDGDYAFK